MIVKVELTGFKEALERKFSKARIKSANLAMAEKMDKVKNEESEKFQSPAKGGVWFKPYSERYAKKQGKSLQAVNLRSTFGNRSIENTTVTATDKLGTISFNEKARVVGKNKKRTVNMAKIMNRHQLGKVYGRKRQIFPKNMAQLPQSVLDAGIKELLK